MIDGKTWQNQPRTPEQIADACEQAAGILEGQWLQGDWYTPPFTDQTGEKHVERMCVEGALAAVLGIDVRSMQRETKDVTWMRNCAVYRAVRDTVREEYPTWIVDTLPSWNDAGERTEQEVLDILHKTAKRVQGVEG